MNQNLSSSATWLTKFVLPAAFVGVWPVWLAHAFSHGSFEWIPAAGWGLACVALLVWTWPIQKAELQGHDFVISNYFTTHRVPVSHLRRFTEDSTNRTPNITLHFEPPTPLGRRVRIIPPFSLSKDGFAQVAKILRLLLEKQTVTSV